VTLARSSKENFFSKIIIADMAKSSNLLGITYSEFDNVMGPKLTCCYPENVLVINGRDEFEATLSDYAIVGKHLCEKIISIRTEKMQFMSYSTALENSKYSRNTLMFSFGFVLTNDANSSPFEIILKKVSSAFVAAEVVYSFDHL
jgi:hypothetical protein